MTDTAAPDLAQALPSPPTLTEAQWMPLQVRAMRLLATDIISLELARPDAQPLPEFDAGAHVDLRLGDAWVSLQGPDDAAAAPAALPWPAPSARAQAGPSWTRSYSLCNDPRERHRYCLAVQREAQGRGGSRWLHERLRPGHWLPVSLPRNRFALRAAPHVVLLAGGIGLTPLLAMAEALWAADRSFELHVGVRHRDRLAFAQRLAQAPWAERVTLRVDGEPGAYSAGTLQQVLARAGDRALAYTCGPAGLMQGVREAASHLGWEADRVVVEHFAAPASAASGAGPSAVALPKASSAEAAFEFTWAPTGQRLQVAEGQSAAQAMQAAGLPVDLSCEQGICGQCVVQVLDGQPDHRDLVYGDREHALERRFTPCCSRAAPLGLVLAPMGWTGALA